jgi:hypothetical protein
VCVCVCVSKVLWKDWCPLSGKVFLWKSFLSSLLFVNKLECIFLCSSHFLCYFTMSIVTDQDLDVKDLLTRPCKPPMVISHDVARGPKFTTKKKWVWPQHVHDFCPGQWFLVVINNEGREKEERKRRLKSCETFARGRKWVDFTKLKMTIYIHRWK